MVSSPNEPIQVAHKNEEIRLSKNQIPFSHFLTSNLIYTKQCSLSILKKIQYPLAITKISLFWLSLLNSIMNDYYYRFLFYSNWQKVKLHRLFDSSYDSAYYSSRIASSSFYCSKNFYNENLFLSLSLSWLNVYFY